MDDKKNTYRNIVKGTAIFGGAQVFNVIINVIRGKLIAMILGPAGMGISALFTSAVTPIQQIATLGLPYSTIRSISGEVDDEKRRGVVFSFRRLMLLAAIIGSVVSIIISPWLSNITFGNYDYTWSFVLLSLALFFYVMNQCYNAILQGYRKLKDLALCNMTGPTAGLIIGIPLYYLYGINGIVPAMILLAFVSCAVSYYGISKIDLKTPSRPWRDVWDIGKGLIGLGVTMMIASALGNLSNFSLNAVIRSCGTISDVGLFQAANSIVNQYVGMVIAAIATDYYPHLSSIVKQKDKAQELVNEEGEITLFVIAPIAALIVITAPLIIKIFLTSEFDSVLSIIRYMGLGVILKASVFPLGYLAIANGDKKFYFCMDGLWTNIKTFALFALFYYLWGFNGLGYATLLNSVIDIIVVTVVYKWRYGISYNRKLGVQIVSLYVVVGACLLCSFISNIYVSYLLMILISILLFFYCYKELDRRIDIRGIVLSRLKRK